MGKYKAGRASPRYEDVLLKGRSANSKNKRRYPLESLVDELSRLGKLRHERSRLRVNSLLIRSQACERQRGKAQDVRSKNREVKRSWSGLLECLLLELGFPNKDGKPLKKKVMEMNIDSVEGKTRESVSRKGVSYKTAFRKNIDFSNEMRFSYPDRNSHSSSEGIAYSGFTAPHKEASGTGVLYQLGHKFDELYAIWHRITEAEAAYYRGRGIESLIGDPGGENERRDKPLYDQQSNPENEKRRAYDGAITEQEIFTKLTSKQGGRAEDLKDCAVAARSRELSNKGEYEIMLGENELRQRKDERLVRVLSNKAVDTVTADRGSALYHLDSVLEQEGLVPEWKQTESGVALAGIKGLGDARVYAVAQDLKTGQERRLGNYLDNEFIDSTNERFSIRYVGNNVSEHTRWISSTGVRHIYDRSGHEVEGAFEVARAVVTNQDIAVGGSVVLKAMDINDNVVSYEVRRDSQLGFTYQFLERQGYTPVIELSQTVLKQGQNIGTGAYIKDVLWQGKSVIADYDKAVDHNNAGLLIEEIGGNGERREALSTDGYSTLSPEQALIKPGMVLGLTAILQGVYDRMNLV